ncbi:MAG: 2-C-methyl-D-erythritol 4-phosphate cytidylyltransferase [Coriobacteriia bacterium]
MNAAIIVAGGGGERTGLDGGKQLAAVAGRPVLYHTVSAFVACAAIDAIVVVTHPERVEEYRAAAVAPLGSPKIVGVIGGGGSRQESVARGLAAVPADADVIAVHDGARPLVTPALIAEAIDALDADAALDGVVVGHPSYDTLKLVGARDRVAGTLDRTTVWAAQTPQVFRAPVLRRAYARAEAEGFAATDDASLVERAGGSVRMLAGPRDNIKVTVPEDMLIVERLLRTRVEGAGDE